MKKILIITLAVAMSVLMCAAEVSAVSVNYLIDEGYPKLSADESTWEIMCWTVSDNEIVSVGYILDNGDIVWAINEIGHVATQNGLQIKPNDCFRDDELENAVVTYGMSAGLKECFAYRIHLTLDTSRLSKGKHTFEFVAKYGDGKIDNPLTGESGIKTFKIKRTIEPEPKETTEDPGDDTSVDTGEPDNYAPGDVNKDGSIDNKDVVALFRYVSGTDKVEDESAYDYNGDKTVDNKDVVALFRFVSSK